MPKARPSPSTPGQPSFLAQVLAIARKDLRIEWRSREIVYTTLFLALLLVLVFAFAFISGDETPGPGVTAGILWVAVLFSGTVALARIFDRERENEAIRSLLLSPVPRAAIYLGKLLATTVLMLLVEAVVTPICGLLFHAAIGERAGALALMLLLGTIGFGAVGVVFSAALLRARNRDALLASLLFPVVVPVFLAGANGTGQLLDVATADLGGARFWTQFLAATDVVLVAVGLWAFEPIVSGE